MKKAGKKDHGRKIATLALLAGLGLVSFLLESLLPSAILPGAKLGISNLFTLFALAVYGLPEALLVTAVRTVLGSLFAGNPSLLLYSLTAGVTAAAAARLLLFLPRVSLLAVSVAQAVVHNLVQLSVYCALTQTLLLISYAPWLCLFGVLAGALVGGAAITTIRALPDSALQRIGARTEELI